MNRFFLIVAALAAALTVANSCNKESRDGDIVAYLSADDAFVEGQARINVNLTSASSSKVTVLLGVGAVTETALKAQNIEFSVNPVTISPGATEATITVSLKTGGLNPGKYQAVIAIISVEGGSAHKTLGTVYIDAQVGGSYSGGGGDGGDSGSSTPGEGSTAGWSITYNGFIPFTYTYGGQSITENCEVFTIAGTGKEYYYIWIDDAGFYESEVKGQDVKTLVPQLMQEELAYYTAMGESATVTDLIQSGEGQVAYEEFENGPFEAFIFGTDSKGNPNGKYAWCSGTKTGSSVEEGDDWDEPEVDFSTINFKENSSYSIVYAGTKTDDGDLYEFFTVSGTGNKPYSIIMGDKGFISSKEDMVAEVEDDYLYWIDLIADYPDYTILDILDDKPGTVNSWYAAYKGEYDAYLIIYSASTGTPTGEYAKTTFTSQSTIEYQDTDPYFSLSHAKSVSHKHAHPQEGTLRARQSRTRGHVRMRAHGIR